MYIIKLIENAKKYGDLHIANFYANIFLESQKQNISISEYIMNLDFQSLNSLQKKLICLLKKEYDFTPKTPMKKQVSRINNSKLKVKVQPKERFGCTLQDIKNNLKHI